jgi:hypothetical protein
MPNHTTYDPLTNEEVNLLEASIEERISKEEIGTLTEVVGKPLNPVSWWSVHNAMTISASTLFFGLVIIIVGAYLVRKGADIEGVTRLLATNIILIGAIFLVVAGYTETQVAPVIGLLGTIAGYLLGKAKQEHG